MESIWTSTVNIKERDPLAGDISTGAAVIGGGMAGILIAWYLQQRGIETVVLEENFVGNGQTGFTTAKITCQHNLIYDKLIRLFGVKNARCYARANLAAIGEYHKLIGQNQIDCDFSWQPAYLYSLEKTEELEREAKAARQLGINAEFSTYTGLPFKVKGAVKFERQAQFHPLKFLDALSKKVTVYERTKVLSVEGGERMERGAAAGQGVSGLRQGKKSCLVTDKGLVTADHVIFACHFPFINFPGLYFARMHQERSYVIALENAAMPEGMYLGIDKESFSLRSAGKYVLLGGGSHRTGENRASGSYELLAGKAGEWFPGSRIAQKWSAQDCMSMDGVPFIGRFAGSRPQWYVATGFNKWGMTSSMVAAQILPDLICGTDNVYAPVFSPQRFKPGASAVNLVKNLWVSATGLTKGAFTNPGKEEKITRRCPHLGCKLEWNADEQTWECPCHGSCFDKEGQKLEGPAQEDIAQDRE